MEKSYKWKCLVCDHVNDEGLERCQCCSSFCELNAPEIEERKQAWQEGKVVEDGILQKDWMRRADEGKTDQIYPKATKYKEKWILRILVVLLSSVIIHFLLKDYYDQTLLSHFRILGTLLVLVVMETITVNLLTKRNFYPACHYVDFWFPDREGVANKIGYTIVYLFYAVGCVWVIVAK